VTGRRVIVVGGGAAGLMAAGQAAIAGADVLLLEKMKLPGRKLGITGKGRCNLTNVAEQDDFIEHFGATGPFLQHAFSRHFAPELMSFFEELRVPLVTERGGRVFPASGKATDVSRALHRWVERCGVTVRTGTPVEGLLVGRGNVRGVVAGGRKQTGDAVVLASGGASYPRTGSTGDGYAMAKSAGHGIVAVRPALVPLETAGPWARRVSGLNLRNVNARLLVNGKARAEAFGELTFVDYGVGGPVALTLSGRVVDALRAGESCELAIDLKPALSAKRLDARLRRDFSARGAESLSAILRGLLPRGLVSACIEQAGVVPECAGNRVAADEQRRLVKWLKDFRLAVTGHRPIDEAIVTAGGVDTSQVDPATMASRVAKGLYIAGELLDVQADTGGYNLQAAFSTGWMAGVSAAGGERGQDARANGRRLKASATGHRLPPSPEGLRRTRKAGAAVGGDFLPTTREEVVSRGWDGLDVILVTGDSYIDSPFVGVAMIGRVLEDAGYRVGIIAQPDVTSGDDIARLGEPALFWGVTAGCIDSMVANRTASGKRRKRDDYTPGGQNNRRPDRATLVYSNLIRQHFKQTRPIVLGGIEASLRRAPHYDYWSDRIRKSVLFDAKADYLLYGMAERSVVELAACLRDGNDPRAVRGVCFAAGERPEEGVELPSFAEVAADNDAFTRMFHALYRNNDPVSGQRLFQQQDTRYLVMNPPARYLSEAELDAVHGLQFEREQHPYYQATGDVKALETIRFSIATHRGCYGECSFCAIAVHEGRTVRCRSESSILAEARQIADHPKFKGTIHDVGGPTANMFGFECARKAAKGACPDKRCLHPEVCAGLNTDHGRQVSLLRKLRKIKGVRKVVIASGIRHDMVLADRKHGAEYLGDVVAHHVSGQMKVAPEHSERAVLELMGKPGPETLLAFRKLFMDLTRKIGKQQFLTYYLIAAHPGCTLQDMQKLRAFAQRELKLLPRQVQVFTPTPSTYATLMYRTGRDPFTGKPCFVEKTERGRERQKQAVLGGRPVQTSGR
jgi:uncharacterized radical SAM protein YgiQ